jgi:hypothetical protein
VPLGTSEVLVTYEGRIAGRTFESLAAILSPGEKFLRVNHAAACVLGGRCYCSGIAFNTDRVAMGC